MARSPRRGKGSDKSNDGKISNTVSASDRNPGRADEAYTPSAPKPPQPPRVGRTDLNAAQGFQRQQQMYSSTTPQMSKLQQAKLDAMKDPAPKSDSPAPRGMGMGSSYSPEEDPRNASITDEELSALARQSVDATNGKGEQPEWAWMNEAVQDRYYDAIGKHQYADEKEGYVRDIADQLSPQELNSLSVEGETIQRGGYTYSGKDGKIVVESILSNSMPEEDRKNIRLDGADIHNAISDRLAAEPSEHEARWAVFYDRKDKEPLQFTDSSMSQHKAIEDLLHLQGVFLANSENAVAARLRAFDLTDEEIKAERSLPPQEQPRHERVYNEITGEQFSSLSIPPSATLSGKEHVAVLEAFEKAPAVSISEQPVRANEVVDRSPEGLQKHADSMFQNGRDLRDIHSETGTKPEGADQTAWEKTEYVYGQPTALDRLRDLGTGAFAASTSGYTYAMSADGNSLIRFDFDGNPAGEKPVQDVQAFLQAKRGVEFDAMQEAKQQDEAQQAENRRLEIALTEGKRPDDMSEAQWEQEQKALNEHLESLGMVDEEAELATAIFERQQAFGSDESVWTQEGYDEIRAEILADREKGLQSEPENLSYEEERDLVYATNNADEIAAFEDRAYENSDEEMRFLRKSAHFEYLEDVERGVELSGYADDRTIVDDLRAKEGATVNYRGHTYELNEDTVKVTNEAEGHWYRAYTDALQEGMQKGIQERLERPSLTEIFETGAERPKDVSEEQWAKVAADYTHQMTLDNTPEEFLPNYNEDLADLDGQEAHEETDYNIHDELPRLEGLEGAVYEGMIKEYPEPIHDHEWQEFEQSAVKAVEAHNDIQSYEGSITDDLQAQHFGAKIPHDGKDYHLEGSELVQSEAGDDLRRADSAQVEQATKDIFADKMPAGIDRDTFAMSTATMGYTDGNNGKSMVSQLGELPEGSKVNYADFDYRLDGNQIVASQSIELNRVEVYSLELVAEKKQEMQQQQAVEVAQQDATEVKEETTTTDETKSVREQPSVDVTKEQEKAVSLDTPEPSIAAESKEESKIDNKAETEEVSKVIDQANPVSSTEQQTEVKSDPLRESLVQGKTEYDAKQLEQATSTDAEKTVDVTTGDDLRSSLAQNKAEYDAKQQAQPEQKVQEMSQQQSSEQSVDTANSDLRAELVRGKAASEEQQVNPPEPAVDQQEEEEYHRGPAMRFG